MHPEDERLGRLVRLIRRRAEKTQVELAKLAKVPLADLKLVESGRARSVRLGRVRALLEALDGRARLIPWWNGAAADRLLDERHAAIAERSVRHIGSLANWQPQVEVTFAEYGERGSIDLLATNRVASAVFVGEVKSAVGSLEETNRTLDVKAGLAPQNRLRTPRLAAARRRESADRGARHHDPARDQGSRVDDARDLPGAKPRDTSLASAS